MHDTLAYTPNAFRVACVCVCLYFSLHSGNINNDVDGNKRERKRQHTMSNKLK